MDQAIPGLTEDVRTSLEEMRVNLRAEMSLLADQAEGSEGHQAFREIADVLDRCLGDGYPYIEPKGWLWAPVAAEDGTHQQPVSAPQAASTATR